MDRGARLRLVGSTRAAPQHAAPRRGTARAQNLIAAARRRAGRMRRLGLCLLLVYAACQKPGEEEDVCDEAQAHLEECKLSEEEPAVSECTEREECRAACIVESSCEELERPDPDGSYIECLVDCERKRPGENSD